MSKGIQNNNSRLRSHLLFRYPRPRRSQPVFSKMATRKRDRPAEGYYRNFEGGFRLKAEKVSPKTPHKMDQEKL